MFRDTEVNDIIFIFFVFVQICFPFYIYNF